MARFTKVGQSPQDQLKERAAQQERVHTANDEAAARARGEVDHQTDRIARQQRELGIARFEDTPEAASLFKIRRALLAGVGRIEAETDAISIRRYLDRASSGREGRQHEKLLKERLKKREAELGIADTAPPAPKQGELPEAILHALDALTGDTAVKTSKRPETRLAELADKRDVLEAGIHAVDVQLDDLRSTAAYEQATRLQKRHGELLVSLFRAAQKFSAAAEQERLLRAALAGAGYQTRSDLTPAPGVLGAVLTLGSEHNWESQISEYRRFLQSRALLP